ncbi:MAG: hypothetical protein V5A34_13335, partial [Halapricum sp.]
DRSERLRKRRQQTGNRGDKTNGQDDTNASDSNAEAESTEESDDQQPTSVKDQQVGTYMYLPEDQTKDLRRLYNVLKAEYEFTYDEDFEKNRHFYPLVIQYGLESLEGLEASEIREYLDSYYE